MMPGYCLTWRDSEEQRIPFINGLPLCSLRHPQREAEKWRALQKASGAILVLGVGAGFHLPLCPSQQILVYDSNPELVRAASGKWKQLSAQLTSCQVQLEKYLENLPAVWTFRPAFNGRPEELSQLESFIQTREIYCGEKFLGQAGLKEISQMWRTFDHHSYKLGIHHLAEIKRQNLSEQEALRIDILRELVR